MVLLTAAPCRRRNVQNRARPGRASPAFLNSAKVRLVSALRIHVAVGGEIVVLHLLAGALIVEAVVLVQIHHGQIGKFAERFSVAVETRRQTDRVGKPKSEYLPFERPMQPQAASNRAEVIIRLFSFIGFRN